MRKQLATYTVLQAVGAVVTVYQNALPLVANNVLTYANPCCLSQLARTMMLVYQPLYRL